MPTQIRIVAARRRRRRAGKGLFSGTIYIAM
jgi:hypothetical protein